MAKTTWAFIRRYNSDILHKLIAMGYDYNPQHYSKAEGIACWTTKDGIASYRVCGERDINILSQHPLYYDCGTNEDLFLSLVAMNDENDFMQLFISREALHKDYLTKSDVYTCKTKTLHPLFIPKWVKATKEQIIKYHTQKPNIMETVKANEQVQKSFMDKAVEHAKILLDDVANHTGRSIGVIIAEKVPDGNNNNKIVAKVLTYGNKSILRRGLKEEIKTDGGVAACIYNAIPKKWITPTAMPTQVISVPVVKKEAKEQTVVPIKSKRPKIKIMWRWPRFIITNDEVKPSFIDSVKTKGRSTSEELLKRYKVAVKLRSNGLSYEQIRSELGYARVSNVYKLFKKYDKNDNKNSL